MRGTALWVFIVMLLGGLLLAREVRQGAFAGVDSAFFDWLAGSARSEPREAPVAIVAIDEAALSTAPWPWSPMEYALFVEAIRPLQPDVIGIVPVLKWPDGTAASLEGVLLDKLLTLPKVVVAAEAGDLGVDDEPLANAARPDITVFREIEGDRNRIPDYAAFVALPPTDFQLAFQTGAWAAPRGTDAQRSIPLLYRVQGEVVPSFNLQLLMNTLRVSTSEVTIRLGDAVELGERNRIPIDETGGFLLDWRLIKRLRIVPYDALLDMPERSPEDLAKMLPPKGSTLILGRTDPKATRTLVGGDQMATRAEISGAIVTAALTRHFVELPGVFTDSVIVVSIAVLGALLFQLRRGAAIVILIASVPLYALGALSWFEKNPVWVPFTLPCLLLLAVALLRVAWPEPKKREIQ